MVGGTGGTLGNSIYHIFVRVSQHPFRTGIFSKSILNMKIVNTFGLRKAF